MSFDCDYKTEQVMWHKGTLPMRLQSLSVTPPSPRITHVPNEDLGDGRSLSFSAFLLLSCVCRILWIWNTVMFGRVTVLIMAFCLSFYFIQVLKTCFTNLSGSLMIKLYPFTLQGFLRNWVIKNKKKCLSLTMSVSQSPWRRVNNIYKG